MLRQLVPRIQYLSDLHLEYRKTAVTVKAGAPYLALCGDIGNPFKQKYTDFLHKVSGQFDKVFVVAGNHEYWHHPDMNAVNDQIYKVCGSKNNLFFLKDDKHILDCGTTVYGSTLWSSKHDRMHTECVKLIENMILKSNINQNIIMLTHFLPSFDLITDEFKRKYCDTQDRWATDLNYLIRHPVSAWICGHSHCKITKYINGVKCVINATDFTTPILL